MRNIIGSPTLKAAAEQKAEKPVKGILQRGNWPQRVFEVWFEDGSHKMMHIPKPPREEQKSQ